METVKVAALQMNSCGRRSANLELAARLLGEAAEQGVRLAVLPENFALMTDDDMLRWQNAEPPGDGPCTAFLSDQARTNQIFIVGGTVPVRIATGQRVLSSCMMVDERGELQCRYDKIHLFDVALSDGESYRESDGMCPGSAADDNIVCCETPAGRAGLSICYDLRFPELYRRLVDKGAQLVTVPSAFTAVTGQAHWRTLLRARAIENQVYVIAAAQWGEHAGGRRTHGHSMVIDPWGRVLACSETGNSVVTAEVDPALQRDLRQRFPALQHRRLV